MDIFQITALVALSFGLAAFLIWLSGKLASRTQSRSETPQAETDARLIYRAGTLVDANSAGRSLMKHPGDHKDEWRYIAALLANRFPGFPAVQGCVDGRETRTFPAHTQEDQSLVVLEQWENMARITVQCEHAQAMQPVSHQPANEQALADAPYPIWQSDAANRVTWANAAYFRLAENLGIDRSPSGYPYVFESLSDSTKQGPTRTAVPSTEQNQSYWFDVSTIESNGSYTHYATDANAIVNAEIAQRNFVQTLTKTFAQLSIGLAIFDRNRQLALFNPALIDLTALPADFLSSRPNLLTFFDRMRENRMMPEPRNYASWREQIAELVVAASDDRYTETWTLASGVTYRVVGRPHPDGAIAFLFEDISAEVSLTQRFRADLELGLSTLDTVQEGVAVFSPTGKLGFCNHTYRTLWDCEPELSVTEYSLQEALHHWRVHSQKTDVWERLRHHILDLNPRETWEAQFCLTNGDPVTLRVVSLNGGFTSVLFSDARPAASNPETPEILAG